MPHLETVVRAALAVNASTRLWVATGGDAAGARADAVTVKAGIEGA